MILVKDLNPLEQVRGHFAMTTGLLTLILHSFLELMGKGQSLLMPVRLSL